MTYQRFNNIDLYRYENISIIELDIRKDWIGKSLRELELRKMHEINVIALTDRNGVSTTAQPDDIISDGMKVIVVADKNKIKKISRYNKYLWLYRCSISVYIFLILKNCS